METPLSVNLISGKIRCEDLRKSGKPLFLIHGGAGPADPKGPDAEEAHTVISEISLKLSQANHSRTAFSSFLQSERGPKHAAELYALLGAQFLECHPRFNAGYGAALQEDGNPRVSAAFMESERQKFSAVMNALEVLHPSELAYWLQAERFPVLDGSGAVNLARDLAVPRANLIAPHRFERWASQKRAKILEGKTQADGKGTIGCVVLDAEGHLAATTSTGGVGNETVGRVGDTPTVAGNYCTKKMAISCTGYGEQILNLGFATRVATRVEDGLSLHDAMQRSLTEALALNYEFAAIVVGRDPDGDLSWVAGTTADYFVWAGETPSGLITFRKHG